MGGYSIKDLKKMEARHNKTSAQYQKQNAELTQMLRDFTSLVTTVFYQTDELLNAQAELPKTLTTKKSQFKARREAHKKAISEGISDQDARIKDQTVISGLTQEIRQLEEQAGELIDDVPLLIEVNNAVNKAVKVIEQWFDIQVVSIRQLEPLALPGYENIPDTVTKLKAALYGIVELREQTQKVTGSIIKEISSAQASLQSIKKKGPLYNEFSAHIEKLSKSYDNLIITTERYTRYLTEMKERMDLQNDMLRDNETIKEYNAGLGKQKLGSHRFVSRAEQQQTSSSSSSSTSATNISRQGTYAATAAAISTGVPRFYVEAPPTDNRREEATPATLSSGGPSSMPPPT